ncbi:hypothetical protein [Zobellella denitrificans]|jgi:hypothetical protein|uniref:Uncharacterized protein n=1 Tax=Zobellella denitrificans TaxID=347534 RepID=A0A291HU29_9GAMM|nr:hypothetical protein [Zobellella denitrificans]ATG75599.1 hypothetical protein AN401_18540 [Zobellella denitrificans]
MLLWILLLGAGLLVTSLLVNQGRAQGELEERIRTLEADNRQLRERINTLEELVLEREKRRPFEDMAKNPDQD